MLRKHGSGDSTEGPFNRYWYANANPYKFTDPDGRKAWPDLGSLVAEVKNAIVKQVADAASKAIQALLGAIKAAVDDHLSKNTYTAQVGVSGTIAAPVKNGTLGPSTGVTGGVSLSLSSHGQVALTASGGPLAGWGGGATAGASFGASKTSGGAVPTGFSTSQTKHAEFGLSVAELPVAIGGSTDWNAQGGSFSAGSAKLSAGEIMFVGGGAQQNITCTFNEGTR